MTSQTCQTQQVCCMSIICPSNTSYCNGINCYHGLCHSRQGQEDMEAGLFVIRMATAERREKTRKKQFVLAPYQSSVLQLSLFDCYEGPSS
jgi:hypothetical protein